MTSTEPLTTQTDGLERFPSCFSLRGGGGLPRGGGGSQRAGQGEQSQAAVQEHRGEGTSDVYADTHAPYMESCRSYIHNLFVSVLSLHGCLDLSGFCRPDGGLAEVALYD